MMKYLFYGLLAYMLGMLLSPAFATECHNNATSNYYETTMITNGVSDKDLAQALALSFSMNHPFDFATHDWQGSVTGAYYDDENAVSFGVGKRFKKMDALWHIEAGQNGSNEALVGGVVFRF